MQRLTLKYALSTISGVLLGACFYNAWLFPLAWFGFVPLLFALQNTSMPESYGLGLICGLACHVVGAYWIIDFIILFKNLSLENSFLPGIAFWFYSAQLVALASLAFNWFKTHTDIHDFWLFPVVISVFHASFPTLFSGQPGASQSRFLLAMQATDLLGVSALDALIGLVNVMIFYSMKRQRARTLSGTWITASIVVVAWFGYGIAAWHYWKITVDTWQTVRIGIVQPDEKPYLGPYQAFPGYSLSYPPEMDMTERLAAAGAQLVIWPEARYKGYFDFPQVQTAFTDRIRQLQTPLLFQDMDQTSTAGDATDKSRRYNTAIMITSDGTPLAPYQKIKRVAFGEYLPWLAELPWLRPPIEDFFGEFTNEIAAGKKTLSYDIGMLKIIPLICYDVMFSGFVAEAVPEQAHGQVLAVMSSNGWFGTTIQPFQHAHASALRAVENRLPLIHAINNGPSTVVLPDGRFIYQGPYHQPGGFIVDMPHSPQHGGSFYSRHPSLFHYFLYCAMLVFIFASILDGLYPLADYARSQTPRP